jgi:hypothetical protein
VTDEPDGVIGAVLRPGEQLLWAGRPPLGVRLRAVDAVLIPLSAAVIAVAVWFVGYGVAWGAPWVFQLFGAVLIFGLLAGQWDRYVGDARRRGRTFYGVTSERVVVLSGGEVTSLPWATLPEVSLFEGQGGAGVITFGPCSPLLGWSLRTGFPLASKGLRPAAVFDLAAEAPRVYALVRSARDATGSAAGR